MKKILLLVGLMGVYQSSAVIFVNTLNRPVEIELSPKRYQYGGETYIERDILLEVNPLGNRYYDGSIRILILRSKDSFKGTFRNSNSPALTQYLFERPNLVIKIIEDKEQNLQISPSIKELEELMVKEHQTQVKPKLQEALPQLPRPLIDITTQYCTPLQDKD